MNVVPVQIHVLEVAQLINLILADGRLIFLPIGDVKGLIHHVRVDPILGGYRYASMALGDPGVTAVDIGVGESCPGNAHGGSASSSAHGVVGSPPPNTQGGALLPKVPSNSRKEFDTASESKKAHGEKSR